MWKVTPVFSSWLSSPNNIFSRTGLLDAESTAVELGSGISGLVALSLAPQIKKYLVTDQPYVLKLLKHNITENSGKPSSASQARKQVSKGGDSKHKAKRSTKFPTESYSHSSIEAVALDWEAHSVLSLRTHLPSTPSTASAIDIIIACDCIYNESLIPPFVSTCTEMCRKFTPSPMKPTVCVIAQQLRSPDVFEAWLKELWKEFRVWRVPDDSLDEGIKDGSGFVVHVGVLRTQKKETA